MSKLLFISAYNCDSDDDYWAQFEDQFDDANNNEPEDDDWQDDDYIAEVVWESQY